MSRKNLDMNNGIKKKNNKKSEQRNDNDDDDIGENYSNEFSENVSKDEKYFFPKQTQPTRSYYFSDKKIMLLIDFQIISKEIFYVNIFIFLI